MQVIFHIDLNCFFASAEVIKNPKLAHKPIVVCHNSSKSVITTASYEARKYGIKSAMPLFIAKEKYPKLIVVEPDFQYYRKLSKDFFDNLLEYSPFLEPASIDECYLDVTEYIFKNNIHPTKLALEIQRKILNKLNLPCSIGIAPNKFLAKMASDMKKPLGITLLNKNNFKDLIWPLPIKDLFGIGKKTQEKLIEAKIYKIKDIANYHNYSVLKKILGKNALLFYRWANGIDTRKVNNKKFVPKSIGNSTTLNVNTNNSDILLKHLNEMATSVYNRLINKQMVCNRISITLKYSDFSTITRQIKLDKYTDDFNIIYKNVTSLFEQNFNNQDIRLVGVSLSGLILKSKNYHQISFFELPHYD